MTTTALPSKFSAPDGYSGIGQMRQATVPEPEPVVKPLLLRFLVPVATVEPLPTVVPEPLPGLLLGLVLCPESRVPLPSVEPLSLFPEAAACSSGVLPTPLGLTGRAGSGCVGADFLALGRDCAMGTRIG